MGMSHPVHLLQHGCNERDIVTMTAIAAVDAQEACLGAEKEEPVHELV
jgi:phosphotransacetylase